MRGERGNRGADRLRAASARALGLLAFPLALAALLALAAAPAQAGKTHALKATFGVFSSPSGIAIDEANGNVFVADGFPNNSVEIFGPEGGAPVGVAVTEIEGFDFATEPSGLAIDNSATSPSKGALYVADAHNNAVKKLTLDPVSEEYEPDGELTAASSNFNPLAVAVDAEGNVFVPDFGAFKAGVVDSAIVEFDPTGAEIARIDTSDSFGRASALAFDSAGNLFVQSWGGKGVWRYAANGAGQIEASATPVQITTGSLTGVAVDRDTDTLYVAVKDRLAQYRASCAPVPTPQGGQCAPELEFGFGVLGSPTQRVAVAPNGDIYVVDRGKKNVAIFDLAESVVPDPVTKPASEVKQSAATLNGTIAAAGGPPASCEFEYVAKASFEAEGFASASAAPCSPAGPFVGLAVQAVEAEISGLDVETTYLFRLRASNENGPSFGETLSLVSVGPPKINASFLSQVSFDSASVEGLVNPNGDPNAATPTRYAIEYVSEEDFEASEYDNATSLPAPLSAGGQAIGAGTKDVKVAQQIAGLAAGVSYRFRIVAENEAGATVGPDRAFSTFAPAPAFGPCPAVEEFRRPGLDPSAALPDCRVYEQATPVDKNGAGPSGFVREVQAAAGGDGIVYLSGSGIPGAEGAQQYPTYLSSRASGWSTQGLLPPASGGSSAGVLGWSEDLSLSYVAQADLPGDPASFFQRDNATRSLRPIALEGKRLESFTYLGGAADNSTVFFESDTLLPPGGAAKARNTYVWDSLSEELGLAGVFNNGLPPAKGSLAGPNQTNYHGFYTQAQHTVSSDGSRVFFSDAGSGQLYVRQNPTMPQSALESGKCTEAEMACTIQVSASQRAVPDPKGKKPATFMTAAADGSRVFFTSPGKLTDDAATGPNDEGNDLYRYDLQSEELIDISPDAEPGDPKGADVQGVFGASDDGSYVYFAANGVLAPGATPGDCVHGDNVSGLGSGACNIYLWHDGATVFVAPLQMPTRVWNSGFASDRTSRVSADGKTLLFDSKSQLTDYDSRGIFEFYRYSAPEDELSCVTCNPTGAAPVGAPALVSVTKYGATIPEAAPVLTRNLSADGARIFFETPDKLLPGDTNGDAGCPLAGFSAIRYCQDVYEWEANGSGSCESEAQNGGCLYLISTGTSPYPAYFADASADGEDAFIYTVEPLVGQDRDRIVDIYDARVGGGLAAQNPPAQPEPCAAETSCRGATPVTPVTQSPGSSGFVGPGNQKPSAEKKKKKKSQKKKQKKKSQKKKQKKRHSAGKRR